MLEASGFWGGYEAEPETTEPVPLLALIELWRGTDFQLSRLERHQAWPRLLNEIRVPNAPVLWRPTIAALARLIDAVPVFRMSWSPAEPPWSELESALGPARVLDGDPDPCRRPATAGTRGIVGGSP
jgi:hypothetical protein